MVQFQRDDAERAAARVLDDYFFGPPELHEMPVDATTLARFNGAEVFLDDLDDEDLDGFVLITPDGAEITVNSARSLHRRRFTCAHELGHVVLHRERRAADESLAPGRVGFIDDETTLVEDRRAEPSVKRRDGLARAGTDTEEMYANAFAAALLMPENLVRALAQAGQTREQMAKFFRVSPEAMQNRLNRLRLA